MIYDGPSISSSKKCGDFYFYSICITGSSNELDWSKFISIGETFPFFVPRFTSLSCFFEKPGGGVLKTEAPRRALWLGLPKVDEFRESLFFKCSADYKFDCTTLSVQSILANGSSSNFPSCGFILENMRFCGFDRGLEDFPAMYPLVDFSPSIDG